MVLFEAARASEGEMGKRILDIFLINIDLLG